MLARSAAEEAQLVGIGVYGGRPCRCIDGRDDGIYLGGGGIVPLQIVPRSVTEPEEERERHEPVSEAAVLPGRHAHHLGAGPGQRRLEVRPVHVRRSAYHGHAAAGLRGLDYRLRARLRGAAHVVHGGEVEGRGVLRTVLPGGDPVVEPDHEVPPAHGEDAVQRRGNQRDDAPATGHVVRGDTEIDIDIVHGAYRAPVPCGLSSGHSLHQRCIAPVYRAVAVGIVHVDVLIGEVRPRFDIRPDRRRIVRVDVVVQISIAEDR